MWGHAEPYVMELTGRAWGSSMILDGYDAHPAGYLDGVYNFPPPRPPPVAQAEPEPAGKGEGKRPIPAEEAGKGTEGTPRPPEQLSERCAELRLSWVPRRVPVPAAAPAAAGADGAPAPATEVPPERVVWCIEPRKLTLRNLRPGDAAAAAAVAPGGARGASAPTAPAGTYRITRHEGSFTYSDSMCAYVPRAPMEVNKENASLVGSPLLFGVFLVSPTLGHLSLCL